MCSFFVVVIDDVAIIVQHQQWKVSTTTINDAMLVYRIYVINNNIGNIQNINHHQLKVGQSVLMMTRFIVDTNYRLVAE